MMTARLLARTTDKNTIEVHSLHGDAVVTMTDEYGQSAHLRMDLQTWVTFCHDSLSRAREQYQVLPQCDGVKCAEPVRAPLRGAGEFFKNEDVTSASSAG